MAFKPIEILINAKDNASGVFSSLQSKIAGLGVAIAGYFGIQAFAGAIKGASELEAKMSEVQAVSGATAEELGAMRDAAEEAGASTKFTATESAEALGNLARAGLSAGESVKALTPSLLLAEVGEIGLAESAGIVTKTLAGFNLAAEESGRVADVLAKGADSSDTSVTGLGQALSYAAPTAVALGLSLEQTVAIIGKFADAGIDASRAGTALNSILSQFSNPASKFRQELAAAGITTNDFGQALRELEARGPAGAKAILAVGQEAGPALRGLLNRGIGALDELTLGLNNAGGSAAATAEIMRNNLQGSALGLSSAWDTVKNKLATPVLPILKDGVDKLTEALRKAASDGTVGKFGDAIAKGFQSALTWFKAFAAQVDFDALSAAVSGAADRVGEAFVRLEGYAKTTGSGVNLMWGVMSGGANVLLTAVYKVGEAFAGVASNIAYVAGKLSIAWSKVGIGDAAERMRAEGEQMLEMSGALWASVEALRVKAGESFSSVADSAETAREGWSGLTTETEAASTSAQTSVSVFKALGDTLTTAGEQASAMGQETTKALKSTQASAEETAQAVADAFQRMGVQTKDDLTAAAANAKADFDLIKASGQATSEGLSDAFKKYAESAIAANGGVATDALNSQAAMYGLEVASSSAGKAVVSAMGSGAEATVGLTAGIQQATAAVQEHLGWLDRLEKRNAEVKSSLQADANGFATDASGKTVNSGGDLTTLTGIAAFAKAAGISDDAQAKKLALEFSDGNGEIPYFSNPGQQRYGGDTISAALLKAVEKTTFSSAAISGSSTGSTTVAQQGAREVNVNLTLDGQSYGSVATSDQGSANLESFISALKSSKGTAQ